MQILEKHVNASIPVATQYDPIASIAPEAICKEPVKRAPTEPATPVTDPTTLPPMEAALDAIPSKAAITPLVAVSVPPIINQREASDF